MSGKGQARGKGKVAGVAMGRARGRELALWLLCHLDDSRNGRLEPEDELRRRLELFWREQPAFPADDDFLVGVAEELAEIIRDSEAQRWAKRLVEAFLSAAASFDAAIEGASARWRLARMDRVDRNVLRLAAVELAKLSTPRGVVVSEAVRLAARYGSERSPAFVNGLVEALARSLRDVNGGGGGAAGEGGG
ncbi:transcription antitermination protein NusB [Pseudenhygromyxa sp. WMMC2535]|uniref:transcription antitermination protein NusB n=1 Tax=Pseudenhygromyxa sp. WMMC2535 TaxID=2712867 RepID=UPI0015562731|nr:transcription antitermination protein NusB [Pseudenhygromyxa sp. WMMC2535]NVB42184.1 transcription antitermination protein NusB [Pseudenhygromyxa sp. WMMC2535]